MYGNFEGFPEKKHSKYIVWVGNLTATGRYPDVIKNDINWLVLRISEASTSSALFELVTDINPESTNFQSGRFFRQRQGVGWLFLPRPWWPWLFKANPTRWSPGWRVMDGSIVGLFVGIPGCRVGCPEKNMFGNKDTDGTYGSNHLVRWWFGCITTSSARYLGSITIPRRWLDP